jgi:hypothetical protein
MCRFEVTHRTLHDLMMIFLHLMNLWILHHFVGRAKLTETDKPKAIPTKTTTMNVKL